MKEVFVPYEIAKALAAKGYNCNDCIAFYATKHDQTYNEKPLIEPRLFISENSGSTAYLRKVVIDVFAPTWDQVIDWFKDKHEISVETQFINLPGAGWYGYASQITYTSKERPIPADFGTLTPRYDTRKEALAFSINEALTVI